MMKNAGLIAAAATFALMLPGAVLAEQRQHGNAVMTLPEGWTTGRREHGTLTLLPDLPGDECKYCRVWIAPSQVKTGAPDKLILRNLRLFLEPDDPAPEPIGKMSLTQEGRHKVAMQGVKSGRDVQVLLAVELADRTEIYGFKADSRDEEKLAASLEVFGRDIVPMILTARYLSEGAAPLLGAPTAGGISGVWQGTGMGWTLGLDMTMQMDLASELFVFWEDGTFYDGSPATGLREFDRAAALRAGDMSFGNYRISGVELLLSYADGRRETRKIAAGGIEEGFDCGDDATCTPVQPLPDGTKIDGLIEGFSYSGLVPGTDVTGGITTSSALYFAPDGRWSYAAFTGATASSGSGDATSSTSSVRTGRYRVENGTVIRSFDDKSPEEIAIIFQNRAGDVMIGEDVLKPAR